MPRGADGRRTGRTLDAYRLTAMADNQPVRRSHRTAPFASNAAQTYDARHPLGYTPRDRGPCAGHAKKPACVLTFLQHAFEQRSTQAALTKS
jgi:hypothetical protein